MLLFVIVDVVYSFIPSSFGIPDDVQRLNVSKMSRVGTWIYEIRDDPYEVQWWPSMSAAGNSLTTPPLDFNEIWVIGVKYNVHGKFSIYFQDVKEEFDEEIKEDKRELGIVYHFKSPVMIHSEITIFTQQRGIINCLYFLPPAPQATVTETPTVKETPTLSPQMTPTNTPPETPTNTPTESPTLSPYMTPQATETPPATTQTATEIPTLSSTATETPKMTPRMTTAKETEERSAKKHTNIILICTLVPLSVTFYRLPFGCPHYIGIHWIDFK